MTAETASWVLFDDSVTGHHQPYVMGIANELRRRGAVPVLGTTFPPPAGLRWIPTKAHPQRAILINRRQLSRVAREGLRADATAFVDLWLDKNVWAATGALDGYSSVVHVLHHATHYMRDIRSGLARIRTEAAIRRLKALAHTGNIVVVHTERAKLILQQHIPPEAIAQVGYPVRVRPRLRAGGPHNGAELLFVGSARHEKGLDLLVQALAITASPDQVRLRVVGRQPPGLPGAMSERYPDVLIEWQDGFVPEEAILEAYESADLAVLPYRSSFGAHGGPSAVLLEALGLGVPILTTAALADQLPERYRGAMIVESDSAEALASGLEASLSHMAEMATAAASDGPAFIHESHTYASYVTGLDAAIERGNARR